MKYIIILGDGMSDEPIAALDGKTPLAYAETAMLDSLSKRSRLGMAQTIPPGMNPGSDTANLSVLGFDPVKYYSGRSPLEALNIGAPMEDGDIAVRLNIVTISDDDIPFAEKTIIDHSAGEIETADAAILLEAVKTELSARLEALNFAIYPGTSYRHCLIWKGGKVLDFTPPHDVLTQVIEPYLPKEIAFRELMELSHQILQDHPINKERIRKGKNPANCFWFWGAGTKPCLSSFEEKTGRKGIMISAVDLLKGIGVATGMTVADVPGANGSLNTNYAGKVDAACKALLNEGYDFAYIHIEAPDEMSHQGDMESKVKAIEYLDEKVIAPIFNRLTESGEDFRLLIMPDHPTPLHLRTHTADSVPFLLYDSRTANDTSVTFPANEGYNEAACKRSGDYIEEGHKLIDELINL
ncbi:MAG: cofactor-independent phosphoglycerate mutase [Lachnospiraceae bacterium]|nr:cofactor-independent phosphoglycerate mutase [Lachnospiraceae bacterium]